ncbi:MAG: hypothetical protein E7Z84_06945 [Methanosphaera stadtmanae]|nr:hypothetical protein [Methanosphaera stadtmanae]
MVCIIYFIIEISDEYVMHIPIKNISILLIFSKAIIDFIMMGICLHYVLHCINIEEGHHPIKIKSAFKEGISDYIIEIYYILLSFVLTAIGALFTGFYSNLWNVLNYSATLKLDTQADNIITIIGNVPVNILNNFYTSLFFTMIIFSVAFILMFSFCTLIKVSYIETEDLKSALNPLNIYPIVKKIGFKRYIKFFFVITLILTCIMVIISLLNEHTFMGSIISCIIEGFIIFFFTYSFTLLYHDTN